MAKPTKSSKSIKHIKNKWQQNDLEKKRLKKIVTLRKYAQLCKHEGVDSDRINLKKKSSPNNENISTEKRREDSRPKIAPKPKVDRLQKLASDKQNAIEEQLQQKKAEMGEKIQKIKESIKHRKDQHKLMTKKNAKGQPVLGGRIKNILDKLIKERE